MMDFMAWYFRAPLFYCTSVQILDQERSITGQANSLGIGTVVYFTVRTVIRFFFPPSRQWFGQNTAGFFFANRGLLRCPV